MHSLHTLSIWPIDRTHIRCYHSGPEWTWMRWQWRGTPHSLKIQHYRNLTIRLFLYHIQVILQRSSLCIQQPQPTEQTITEVYFLQVPFWIKAKNILPNFCLFHAAIFDEGWLIFMGVTFWKILLLKFTQVTALFFVLETPSPWVIKSNLYTPKNL